jgi:hypothetical protein
MGVRRQRDLGAEEMKEHQRLFLVQARTDFAVFEVFRKRTEFPVRHALHYLQMATELLGKAHAWKHGPKKKTHRAFVNFLKSLATNRQAQQQLGYRGRNENWEHTIRKSISLAQAIEDLAPDLAGDGPNPEYPWPPGDPATTPAEHRFSVWEELVNTAGGRQFLGLLKGLFAAAEAFL